MPLSSPTRTLFSDLLRRLGAEHEREVSELRSQVSRLQQIVGTSPRAVRPFSTPGSVSLSVAGVASSPRSCSSAADAAGGAEPELQSPEGIRDKHESNAIVKQPILKSVAVSPSTCHTVAAESICEKIGTHDEADNAILNFGADRANLASASAAPAMGVSSSMTCAEADAKGIAAEATATTVAADAAAAAAAAEAAAASAAASIALPLVVSKAPFRKTPERLEEESAILAAVSASLIEATVEPPKFWSSPRTPPGETFHKGLPLTPVSPAAALAVVARAASTSRSSGRPSMSPVARSPSIGFEHGNWDHPLQEGTLLAVAASAEARRREHRAFGTFCVDSAQDADGRSGSARIRNGSGRSLGKDAIPFATQKDGGFDLSRGVAGASAGAVGASAGASAAADAAARAAAAANALQVKQERESPMRSLVNTTQDSGDVAFQREQFEPELCKYILSAGSSIGDWKPDEGALAAACAMVANLTQDGDLMDALRPSDNLEKKRQASTRSKVSSSRSEPAKASRPTVELETRESYDLSVLETMAERLVEKSQVDTEKVLGPRVATAMPPHLGEAQVPQATRPGPSHDGGSGGSGSGGGLESSAAAAAAADAAAIAADGATKAANAAVAAASSGRGWVRNGSPTGLRIPCKQLEQPCCAKENTEISVSSADRRWSDSEGGAELIVAPPQQNFVQSPSRGRRMPAGRTCLGNTDHTASSSEIFHWNDSMSSGARPVPVWDGSDEDPTKDWRMILQERGLKWRPEGDDRVSIGMYLTPPQVNRSSMSPIVPPQRRQTSSPSTVIAQVPRSSQGDIPQHADDQNSAHMAALQTVLTRSRGPGQKPICTADGTAEDNGPTMIASGLEAMAGAWDRQQNLALIMAAAGAKTEHYQADMSSSGGS
eukprot:TRINITY_DN32317_c0_g1_i1.p1 TRINITY_DN32317_c0_g1~~TRINITY_DN32317_c0_g1_i1.p1  ORF type:complete len:933 (-),score=176.21 TRINITY_DN32317_c0_g1_i1:58-2733(-)